MVTRRAQLLASSLLLALASAPAAAQSLPAPPGPPREVRVLARLGLDGGGATLAKVQLSDGSTQRLSSGGLVTIAAGLLYAPVASPVVVEGTLGYKVDDVTASNGQLKFARWPLELLASYRVERHRFGGGLTRHLSPRYSCSLDFATCNPREVNFDDATGLVAQYAYGELNGRFYWDLGARITFIEYQAAGESISGNSVGAFVSIGF